MQLNVYCFRTEVIYGYWTYKEINITRINEYCTDCTHSSPDIHTDTHTRAMRLYGDRIFDANAS